MQVHSWLQLVLVLWNLRWDEPLVFALGRKMICVVGSRKLPPNLYECDQDTDWTRLGEYYHLDPKTWECLPKDG